MNRKQYAVELIQKRMCNNSFLTYKEIAELTGYHPKYILKLKREIIDGTIKIVHGNKDRTPANVMSDEEKQYIIKLYKKSNVSIRKFCNFYHRRSYSCIYKLLKENGLI